MTVHASFEVDIQRVSDGIIRRVKQDSEWHDDEDQTSLFYWTDGNMACDCNRAGEFYRAAGEPRPAAEEECGSSRYRVLRAYFSDGTSVKVDA